MMINGMHQQIIIMMIGLNKTRDMPRNGGFFLRGRRVARTCSFFSSGLLSKNAWVTPFRVKKKKRKKKI